MWYPTHATAYYVGVTHGSFVDVSCQGTPLFDPDKREPNGIGNIRTPDLPGKEPGKTGTGEKGRIFLF
jgi:hypothetical protein